MPDFVVTDSCILTEKCDILNCFNEHFVSSGSLFESLNPDLKHHNEQEAPSATTQTEFASQSFIFSPLNVMQVHKALKLLQPNKSAGPDQLDPYFINLAGDFIAEPLAYIFNPTFLNIEIPLIWKSVNVLPLLKGGDPSNVISSYLNCFSKGS